jgi:hypothetical protein
MTLFILLSGYPRTASCDHTISSADEFQGFAEREAPEAPTDMSLAPILAYEPTFGIVMGGAVFLEKPYDPRYRLFTRAAFSERGEYSVLFNLRSWFEEERFYHLEVEIDDFARPYYGEGMDTSASNSIFLEGTVARVLYHFNSRKDRALTYGPFLDYRAADSESVDGTDVEPPEYIESTVGLGFYVSHDGRDSRLSPTTGRYTTMAVTLVPEPLTTYTSSRTFLQAEVDHRIFHSLGEGLVLAGRLNVGGSWGAPSYQYRYSIGGPYKLRGFYTNRFRGDKFYVVQGELRKHLFWIGSGAIHVEMGEATDDWFESPLFSYGLGLRFTLPPDHIAKARLDFAWSEDQHSIYFIFGEAF